MGVGDRRRPAGRGGGDRCSGLGAPSWGGKGDRRGGGARGDPRSPCAPPSTTSSKEALENWGGRAPLPAGGMWRGGPGAQGEAQQKRSHRGECPSLWWWGGDKDRDG